MADIDSEKERRLVADLLEGDESAFCELYALYKDRLMWFSLKFLKSRDMAEDVFQDVQILGISLTDKTPLRDLFSKTKFNDVKEQPTCSGRSSISNS